MLHWWDVTDLSNGRNRLRAALLPASSTPMVVMARSPSSGTMRCLGPSGLNSILVMPAAMSPRSAGAHDHLARGTSGSIVHITILRGSYRLSSIGAGSLSLRHPKTQHELLNVGEREGGQAVRVCDWVDVGSCVVEVGIEVLTEKLKPMLVTKYVLPQTVGRQ
jgi:hypothetical protein